MSMIGTALHRGEAAYTHSAAPCLPPQPRRAVHAARRAPTSSLPTTPPHPLLRPPSSFEAGKQELFCLDVLDQVVVAGGQGDVLFWDRRTRKPLASFDDMHMDDVTQVRRR
jgi:hypothetical protein